jgi:phosphohistidine phosphatase SixA
MKTILMVRHAKSGWDKPIADFNRKLTGQGKTDAKNMAIRLVKKILTLICLFQAPHCARKKRQGFL